MQKIRNMAAVAHAARIKKMGGMTKSGGLTPAGGESDALIGAAPNQGTPPFKRGGSVEGEASTGRCDKPRRASGGKVKKKGDTHVNIMIGGGAKGDAPPDAGPMPAPIPMPPPPPPMAKPPMPPTGQPIMPGAMPQTPMGRKTGGRVQAGAGTGVSRIQKRDKEH